MSTDSEEDSDYTPGSSTSKCDTVERSDAAQSKALEAQGILSKQKSDEKKSRINAIWEQLNVKDSATILKVGARNTNAKGEQSNIRKASPPEWMVSLGLARQKSSSTFVNTSKDGSQTVDTAAKEEAKKIAAAAIAAAREASITSKEGKIEVSEVRDFAGEEVKVTKFLDPNSKAAEFLKRKEEMMATSSSGLDKLLQQIDKKPKINVLEKSRKDWGDYKQEKELQDELESYNKSGDKYTDKMSFLQRSELREYERERDARIALRAKKQNDVSFAE